jgi:Predicted RNA-binding protein containing KH domain, possibly ribosomal protein
MSRESLQAAIHETPVTVWVGKSGVGAVVDELDRQLRDRDVVKVRLLRSARGEHDTTTQAMTLADRTASTVVDVRGHTAVLTR